MKITAISVQKRNPNRVNVSVDGQYRFSLDAYQLLDLGVKVGRDYDELDIKNLEQESQFGKLYSVALEHCLIRPRSVREVRDYLRRKTIASRDRTGKVRQAVTPEITERVFSRLIEKNYIDDDDEKFARYWVENRFVKKGISRRKLISELKVKGVDNSIIGKVVGETERDDKYEIQKVIAKKKSRYLDQQKMMAYLARLGFGYDDIKQALDEDS